MQQLTDPAAERAVLSCIFQGGHDAYAEVVELLTPESFAVDSNRVLWKCLEVVVRDHPDAVPDIPVLLSAAKSLGYDEFLADQEERKHLRAVTQFPAERANLRRMAAKVRHLHIARELCDELRKTTTDLGDLTGDEAVETILALAQSRLFDYVGRLAATERGGSEIGDGVLDYIQHQIDHPQTQVGLPSGFPRWDRAVGGGFRKKTVSVVGARVKVGKSQFGINVGKNLAVERGVPVLYCDTELNKKDHWDRLLANLANVPVTEVETGLFGSDEQKIERVKEAGAKLLGSPYRYECIAGRPFDETLSVMRRWVMRTVGLAEDGDANDCLIIFDYLKLMDASAISKQVQEYQALGFMMTALHNFAVRYGVPILVLVQLNRDGITDEETNAVSGSDRIGWLCSNLSILKWQSDEELAEQVGCGGAKYTHKLVSVVNRHGPGLPKGQFINVRAEYKYGRLSEGPLRGENEAVHEPAGFVCEVPDDVEFGAGEAAGALGVG